MVGPRQFGRKRRHRTSALGVIAVFRAQVRLYNRLPRRRWSRFFRSSSQAVGDFPKCLAQRLHKQVFLAAEMLVKTTVGQAGASHNGRNRGASDAFGANPPRGIFKNLPMDFDFVLGLIAHGSL